MKWRDLALLDLFGHRLHRPHNVIDQLLFLILAHQTEEVSRLGVVIVAFTMIVAVGVAADL